MKTSQAAQSAALSLSTLFLLTMLNAAQALAKPSVIYQIYGLDQQEQASEELSAALKSSLQGNELEELSQHLTDPREARECDRECFLSLVDEMRFTGEVIFAHPVHPRLGEGVFVERYEGGLLTQQRLWRRGGALSWGGGAPLRPPPAVFVERAEEDGVEVYAGGARLTPDAARSRPGVQAFSLPLGRHDLTLRSPHGAVGYQVELSAQTPHALLVGAAPTGPLSETPSAPLDQSAPSAQVKLSTDSETARLFVNGAPQSAYFMGGVLLKRYPVGAYLFAVQSQGLIYGKPVALSAQGLEVVSLKTQRSVSVEPFEGRPLLSASLESWAGSRQLSERPQEIPAGVYVYRARFEGCEPFEEERVLSPGGAVRLEAPHAIKCVPLREHRAKKTRVTCLPSAARISVNQVERDGATSEVPSASERVRARCAFGPTAFEAKLAGRLLQEPRVFVAPESARLEGALKARREQRDLMRISMYASAALSAVGLVVGVYELTALSGLLDDRDAAMRRFRAETALGQIPVHKSQILSLDQEAQSADLMSKLSLGGAALLGLTSAALWWLMPPELSVEAPAEFTAWRGEQLAASPPQPLPQPLPQPRPPPSPAPAPSPAPEAPVSKAPVSEAPVSKAPVSKAPVSAPPVSKAPAAPPVKPTSAPTPAPAPSAMGGAPPALTSSDPKAPYSLQVASVNTQEQAAALKAKLERQLGATGAVWLNEKNLGARGVKVRVMLGRFADQAAASAALEWLKAKKINSIVVKVK